MPVPERQPLGVTRMVTTRVTRSVATTAGLALLATLSLTATSSPAQAATAPHVRFTGAKAARTCAQPVQRSHFTCFALRRTDPSAVSAAASATRLTKLRKLNQFTGQIDPPGLQPADLTAAYDLPSATGGEGQTVFIVDAFNNPNAEADLAVYRAQYKLPPCTTANGCFRKVNQNGQTSPLPANNAGWAAETALDLDLVSAICPLCHITLVEANDDSLNMLTAVARANAMGAKYVSMSWGGDESSSTNAFDSAYFSQTGVVYTAASGDHGFAGGVYYPAASNRVLAVGGTSLSPSDSQRGWSETAWSGAGSGCSVYSARSAWQGSAVPCAKRASTDLSAVADPATGVSVYLTYGGSGWTVYGGTSASAPIIAAAYALAGPQPAGTSPAKVLYSHPSSLNDVTSGSNGTCSPTAVCRSDIGWDGPTGLGTPRGISAFTTSRGTTPGAVMPGYWASRPVHEVTNAAVPAGTP